MERGVGYVSTIYRFFFRVFTLEDRTLLRERGAFEVDFRERGVWGRSQGPQPLRDCFVRLHYIE